MTDTNIGTDDQSIDHVDEANPLASPTELAGTTQGAIDAEFAARDVEEALDAANAEAGPDGAPAADTVPLDGE